MNSHKEEDDEFVWHTKPGGRGTERRPEIESLRDRHCWRDGQVESEGRGLHSGVVLEVVLSALTAVMCKSARRKLAENSIAADITYLGT